MQRLSRRYLPNLQFLEFLDPELLQISTILMPGKKGILNSP